MPLLGSLIKAYIGFREAAGLLLHSGVRRFGTSAAGADRGSSQDGERVELGVWGFGLADPLGRALKRAFPSGCFGSR